MGSRAGNALRSVTYRLSSAAPTSLPTLLPPIAHALLDCRSLLSAPPASVLNTPDGVALHKFKTQISALLNDNKNPAARWAAVVLVRAAVDLGGWEILQSNGGSWARGLLGILGRATEAPATKKLCVVTLTRIFLLTQEYPTLIREITTPSLPAFVTACLNLIGCSKSSKFTYPARQTEAQAQFLTSVLRSFEYLLPHHPSIFRTFLLQIQPLLLTLAVPTPSDPGKEVSLGSTSAAVEPEVVKSAQSLFCLLCFCAPKSSSSYEWDNVLVRIISDTHATCDAVFRSVIEDWQSSAGAEIPPIITFSHIASQDTSPVGFPAWTSIDAGCERLTHLLGLVQAFITSPTAAQVSFPLGRLTDLLVRITSTTAPAIRSSTAASNMRINEQIGKDEREALFTCLPSIHVAALTVIQSICDRFGTAILPTIQPFTEQLTWVFRHESYNIALRQQSYIVLASLIQLAGKAMTKDQIASLSAILKACCADIIPTTDHQQQSQTTTPQQAKTNPQHQQQKGNSTKSTTLHPDTFLPSPSQPSATTNTVATLLTTSALHLLSTTLTHTPPAHLPRTLRAQLDRTAVLSGDFRAMLASVLSPAPSGRASTGGRENSSILPLLARAHGGRMEVEGLVRPRLVPVLGQGRREVGEEDVEEEEDVDVEVEEEDVGLEEDELDGDVDVDVVMDGEAPVLVDNNDAITTTNAANLNGTAQPQPPNLELTTPTPLLGQPPLPHAQTDPSSTANNTTAPPFDLVPPPSTAITTDPTPTTLKRSLPSTGTTTTNLAAAATTSPSTKRARLDILERTENTTSTATLNTASITAATAAVAASHPTKDKQDGEDVDDDDDDFEIPELNVEPDTEDEEENDDDDDDIGEEDELGRA